MKEKITVLIADDNQEFSRTLATYLGNQEDMEVIGMAKDGLEAVDLIKEKLPELGKIKIVTANYSQYSSRYNAFKEGIIQPAFDYTKSGGALMDLNIYNIHLILIIPVFKQDFNKLFRFFCGFLP